MPRFPIVVLFTLLVGIEIETCKEVLIQIEWVLWSQLFPDAFDAGNRFVG